MEKSPTISQAHATPARATFLWRRLLRGALADIAIALWLLILVAGGLVLSYRQPIAYRMPIDGNIGLYIDGLGHSEFGEGSVYRWTSPYTQIRFAGAGQASWQIAFTFHNPDTQHARTLAIGTTHTHLSTLQIAPGWQHVRIAVPPGAIDASTGTLALVLETDPMFHAVGRDLGVAVSAFQLEQLTPASLPPQVVIQLALTALGMLLILRVLGLPRRWAALASTMMMLIALILLARARIGVLITLPVINQTLLLCVILAPLLRLWTEQQKQAVRPWLIAVTLMALVTFGLRYAGMQHPQFVTIDHILRVHQIEGIAAGNRASVQAELNGQSEWGRDITVPYSLLSYDLFVPLAGYLSTDQLLQVVEAITAALDASVLLLLWHLARHSRLDARSSAFTALLYGLFPVGYLYFHDGSYPTIIGLWCTVVMLLLLSHLVERPRVWLALATTGAVTASILMYVTHLAFVPALLGATFASVVLLGSPPLRRTARLIGGVSAIGLLLAFFAYYGGQLPELIGKTIPGYIALIREQGSIGHDATRLPGPLLGNSVEQMWGHYRIVGIVLAALGIPLALRHRDRWSTHLIVGYGIFLLLTVIADLRFGLWNKHMYFALPGICLAAGPVLGSIERHGRAGQVLVWSLIGYLLYTSVGAWILRVIWYIWSLKTI